MMSPLGVFQFPTMWVRIFSFIIGLFAETLAFKGRAKVMSAAAMQVSEWLSFLLLIKLEEN